MSRRRYDRDFNEFRGPSGPSGLFGFVFAMISMGLNIAFSVLGIVLSVFAGLAGNNRPKQQRVYHEAKQRPQEATAERSTPPPSSPKSEPQAQERQQQTIKKEQVKETFNQKKPEQGSDWNILLFVITLIPIIVTLAMKRLDLAALSLAGGTTLIVIYNMIRGVAAGAKKRKQQKQAEKAAKAEKVDNKEENELESVIKEAFDKVYAIRREIHKIPKLEVKAKLENLCNTSEKIIGEVRANPETMNSVRKFFYYYLDAFTEVFEKYTKLIHFSGSSDEVQKVLAETEKSFDDMDEIFRDMCEGMLEKDMLNLKATINVLKNSNYNN